MSGRLAGAKVLTRPYPPIGAPWQHFWCGHLLAILGHPLFPRPWFLVSQMMHPPAARRGIPRFSAALAAALSFLVPGLGQAYAGQPLLALLFAAPILILIGMVIGALATGTDTVLR